MGNVGGTTTHQFEEKVAAGGYADAGSAKKAIAKMSWPQIAKDRARRFVDKSFEGQPSIPKPKLVTQRTMQPSELQELEFEECYQKVVGTGLAKLTLAKYQYPDLDVTPVNSMVDDMSSSLTRCRELRAKHLIEIGELTPRPQSTALTRLREIAEQRAQQARIS